MSVFVFCDSGLVDILNESPAAKITNKERYEIK